jgi:hypothetical protein
MIGFGNGGFRIAIRRCGCTSSFVALLKKYSSALHDEWEFPISHHSHD